MLHVCFSWLGVLREVKIVLAFPKIFRFDTNSSIKLLSNKIEKVFLLSMKRLYAGRTYHYPCRFETYQLMQLPASPYKHLREQQQNVLESIGHSFYIHNSDHVGLLIKTGRI